SRLQHLVVHLFFELVLLRGGRFLRWISSRFRILRRSLPFELLFELLFLVLALVLGQFIRNVLDHTLYFAQNAPISSTSDGMNLGEDVGSVLRQISDQIVDL